MDETNAYAARLNIDYPEKLDRFTTFFRLLWVIPIGIILSLVSSPSETLYWDEHYHHGEHVGWFGGGLYFALALMIVFRQRYPRWWFDFLRELMRFTNRVVAYLFLLTDQYPSTEEEQSVHLDLDYPHVKEDLNRWLPFVKWFLAIPHYFVLVFLYIVCVFAVIIAWFSIMITGTFPRSLFDFLVGVGRWTLRVGAYAFLMVTDTYPPFSLR